MPRSRQVLKKLRRLAGGTKRPSGHDLQDHGRRLKRKNPLRIKHGEPDPSLTSCAGLLDFGVFASKHGVDALLSKTFDHLKRGNRVVYSMSDVLRLLLDAQVAGESRVFGLERLAADPLFRELAGGEVPGIDVIYRDLTRLGDVELTALEQIVAEEGLQRLRALTAKELHFDLDTTVEPLFGEYIDGARKGHNPRYHARPSYHPLLLRSAELRMIVGAQLRPGDEGFGDADVPTIQAWLRRVRKAVKPECNVYLRVDAAGDCTKLMRACEEERVFFITKARMTKDLRAATTLVKDWVTVDIDADHKPTEQLGEVSFARDEWQNLPRAPRVVALRSTLRTGKQVMLWPELEYSAQAYITNDPDLPLDEVSRRYDLRAGIEPMIGELKGAWGLGDVPSQVFVANHGLFLLKLYAANLLRVYVDRHHAALATWSAAWIRRVLVWIPGKVVRMARQLTVRMPTVSYVPSTS